MVLVQLFKVGQHKTTCFLRSWFKIPQFPESHGQSTCAVFNLGPSAYQVNLGFEHQVMARAPKM